MKKVLLIKIEMAGVYSSSGMVEAFEDSFEEVRSIDWQRIRFNGGTKGLHILWNEILKECATFKPDLIFCQFQRDILTPEQFKQLSEYGFVINYTEDVREDITWYEEVAPHIGLTIFTNMDDCRKFWDKGLRAAYMMVSYNHLLYKPQPKTERNYGDIIFIGNNFAGNDFLNFPQAQERIDMCKFMKEKFGERFQDYGMGMSNQRLTSEQAMEAYNNAKVVITQNNFKREGYCSDRGLNAMACGAITVHQHFEGIYDMFEGLNPLITWSEMNDLFSTVSRLLESPFMENKYMNNSATYTKEKHSWYNRCKFVKGFIKVISNEIAK